MFRITITLEPHGQPGKARLLGEGTIANTADGTEDLGAYRADLFKSPEYAKPGNVGQTWRAGRVAGFPRKKLGPWDLLLRALLAAVGDRNIDAIRKAAAEPWKKANAQIRAYQASGRAPATQKRLPGGGD